MTTLALHESRFQILTTLDHQLYWSVYPPECILDVVVLRLSVDEINGHIHYQKWKVDPLHNKHDYVLQSVELTDAFAQ